MRRLSVTLCILLLAVSAGSFMLRAACTEKATGTITIEVTPAE